jgi:hypothetical protein
MFFTFSSNFSSHLNFSNPSNQPKPKPSHSGSVKFTPPDLEEPTLPRLSRHFLGPSNHLPLISGTLKLENAGTHNILPNDRIKLTYFPHLQLSLFSYKLALASRFPGIVDLESVENGHVFRAVMIRLAKRSSKYLNGREVMIGDEMIKIYRYSYSTTIHERCHWDQPSNVLIVKNLIPGWSHRELMECLSSKFRSLGLKGDYWVKPPTPNQSGYFTDVEFKYEMDVDKVVERFGCEEALPKEENRIVFENVELWVARAKPRKKILKS